MNEQMRMNLDGVRKRCGQLATAAVEVIQFFNDIEKELKEQEEREEHPEPLIKDEKIRKAVRAWAEANDIGVIKIMSGFKVRDVETPCEISFWHNTFVCELVGNSYAIAELCGEEEE